MRASKDVDSLMAATTSTLKTFFSGPTINLNGLEAKVLLYVSVGGCNVVFELQTYSCPRSLSDGIVLYTSIMKGYLPFNFLFCVKVTGE